ncbi:MAG: tetratricopeptide repeat protein [Calditrichia bacterium]
MRLFFVATLLIFLSACSSKTVKENIPEEQVPTSLLELGDTYYSEGSYENAFRAYGSIYNNYPTSREYIDAAIGLSKTYGKLENYEKEFDILYSLLRENLIPSKVPHVYNAIAEFYEESAGISEQLTGEGSGDYLTAINYFDKAIKYPNSEDLSAKGYAQFKIGQVHERLRNYNEAITAYKGTMSTYSETEWANKAEENIASIEDRVRMRREFEQDGLLPTSETPMSTNGSMEEAMAEGETNGKEAMSNLVPQTEDVLQDSTMTPSVPDSTSEIK